MRFIHLYLVGCFVLVVGAVLALWQAGALAQISRDSGSPSVLVIAVGLGIMLAVSSGNLKLHTGVVRPFLRSEPRVSLPALASGDLPGAS